MEINYKRKKLQKKENNNLVIKIQQSMEILIAFVVKRDELMSTK